MSCSRAAVFKRQFVFWRDGSLFVTFPANMRKSALYFLTAALLVICLANDLAAQADDDAKTNRLSSGKIILPPPMSYDKVTSPAAPSTGESIFLEDGDKQFTLFIPPDWKAPASGETSLAIHLNGDAASIIQQHLGHGMTNPFVVVSWGTGTETYRVPFKDARRFGRWLKLVEDKLAEKGELKKVRIVAVDLSAYGGGYGAIREILKIEDNLPMIRRVVLCDAMYASYSKEPADVGKRKISAEHIDPWLPIIRAAVAGKKTFAFTFSAVETTGYASCAECATALGEAVSAPLRPVELDECPAANVDDFPLTSRSDAGHFHLWGYAGAGDQAHATHVAHLGDIWKVLDAAGAP